MITEEVKHEDNKLKDFVDDMVLCKEEDTEEQTIIGLHTNLTAAKQQLTNVGQVLNDKNHKSLFNARVDNTYVIEPAQSTKVESDKQYWT
eukprot:6710996-Heterocapsa_arctica.AAC.1